jgi:hypothetical protein
MAQNGHADRVAQCPLSGAKRKTYAQIELFWFWPEADIGRRSADDPNWTSSELTDGAAFRSMNGAYSDRGSHEIFAIRLPDAMYPQRKS